MSRELIRVDSSNSRALSAANQRENPLFGLLPSLVVNQDIPVRPSAIAGNQGMSASNAANGNPYAGTNYSVVLEGPIKNKPIDTVFIRPESEEVIQKVIRELAEIGQRRGFKVNTD